MLPRLLVLLILAALCRSLVADCVPAEGLVAGGPVIAMSDIVGTNQGTLQGGATASAGGVVGSAFSFDGTNGYAQIPDSAVFGLPTSPLMLGPLRFLGLPSFG